MDTDPRHLLYRVVRGPQLGRLFHAQQGSAEEGLVNFTQAEVRASLPSQDRPQTYLRWLPARAHTSLAAELFWTLP